MTFFEVDMDWMGPTATTILKRPQLHLGSVDGRRNPTRIAIQAAATARSLGFEPRVAILSFSNFGQPERPATKAVRDAVQELEMRKVDFEFDGEMQVNVALDYDLIKSTYPFCRLTGPANVLIMPSLHAANISQKLLTEFADGTVIGPVLQGLNHAVQITSMNAKVSDVLNAAVFAAIEGARK